MNTRVKVNRGESEKKPQQEQPLAIKYRPDRFADVVGQQAAKKSLEALVDSKNCPHAFLFVGPSGVGKTTLARIIANHKGIAAGNLIEIDAATNNGIDDMRLVTSVLQYQGFGDSPDKMIIIDECHALSKAAWQSLLKSVEEPPPHIYWAFCTTDVGKVPDTVKTRCATYDLKPVRADDMFDLLDDVADREQLKVSDRTINMIIDAAQGSARQALVYLQVVNGVEDEAEIEELLSQPGDNPEVIDLCRKLVSQKLTWSDLTAILKKLDMPAESIRIVIQAYLSSCIMGAKTDRQVEDLLYMMGCFAKPFNQSDKLAPLLLAFGDILFQQ